MPTTSKKPTRLLSDFSPEVLESLLATLDALCPPFVFKQADLNLLDDPKYKQTVAHELGRRSVVDDVRKGLAVASSPEPDTNPRPIGWDGTQQPNGW